MDQMVVVNQKVGSRIDITIVTQIIIEWPGIGCFYRTIQFQYWNDE